MKTLVLYNDRKPRPGEKDGVDYHFRSTDQIVELKGADGYVVMDVRGDMQALDLNELNGQLAEGDVFYEGNPFIGRILLEHEALNHIEKVSAFMAPLSKAEISYLKDPARRVDLHGFVTDVMRRKLLRRTRNQKGELSLKDLENIEKRAGSAYAEMREAHRFQWVIPNHDGEDSENWDAFYYPIGSARKSLESFVEILQSQTPAIGEHWNSDLLP